MSTLTATFGLVIPLLAGIALGYFLRSRKHLNLNMIISVTIMVLIFALGFTIGSNNDFLVMVPHVGFSAAVLLFTALLFSLLFVKAARKLMKI